MSNSSPIETLPSSTEWAPDLYDAAFGSVGAPLTMTIGPPVVVPFAASASSSDCACTWPTFSLSNDT